MIKATRITDGIGTSVITKAMRTALSGLWEIDGRNGLYKFGHAVKNDAEVTVDKVVAEYGDGAEHNYRAAFVRAVEIESVMRSALGLEELTEEPVEESIEELAEFTELLKHPLPLLPQYGRDRTPIF